MSSQSNDFSYKYFKNILTVIKSNFDQHLLSTAPEIIKKQLAKPVVFLRHDVDLDPERALTMARIESEYHVKSCYMVMTNCPLYSLQKAKSILNELVERGHEVGLHFDSHNLEMQGSGPFVSDLLLKRINDECQMIEDAISQKVCTISFHRPLPDFLYGPLFIAGRINTYAAELMQWYLSDSKGNWRDGPPIPLLENPKKSILQLLIHPIWWSFQHQDPNERLQSFFEEKTESLGPDDIIEFDNKLASHLSIYRGKKEK